nr:hypothetical protein [Lachnospiraceae bacterium]
MDVQRLKYRKNRLFMLTLLGLVLAVLIMPATLKASDLWNEDYYRANDLTGELSVAERDDLDAGCIEFMKEYETDLVLLSVREEDYTGKTLAESAALSYDQYGYGYGKERT